MRVRIENGDYPNDAEFIVKVVDVSSKDEALELFSKYMRDSDGFVSLEIRRSWKPRVQPCE